MEDPLDMHNKGGVLHHDKVKRKLKTPAQIDTLEKFYNEHKYPSESMKLEFAKQIDLTEKQVSGWFCHRRLKDKKFSQDEVFVKGGQSVSNGAIQDYTSGLRQESCSSTKQGDRYLDSKEVESRMFSRNNSSAAVLASEHRGRHVDSIVSDDRSIGSSSASQERLLDESKFPFAMKPSRYIFRDENYISMDIEGVKRRGHIKESRYAYLQADTEGPAVAFVKRKLGGRYREDGPTLGIIFDQLPPGAFDTPIRDSNCDPYHVEDSMRDRSYNIPRINKEPEVLQPRNKPINVLLYLRRVQKKKADENLTLEDWNFLLYKVKAREQAKNQYRCDMHSIGSYAKVIESERLAKGYHRHYELNGSQLSQKASFAKHINYTPSQTFVMENNENAVGKVFDYNSRKNGRKPKYRIDGRSNNGIEYHYPGNSLRAHENNSLSCPLEYNCSDSMSQREAYGANILNSSSALQSNGFLNTENIVHPRKLIKRGRTSIETPTFEKNCLLRQEKHMKENINISRKTQNIQYQQSDYLMRTSQTFGYAKPVTRDVTTSNGEDETGDSTSSG